MKKAILFIGCLVLASLQLNAQSDVRWGVKGGVNFASINGDDTFDHSGKTGFHFGGFVEIPLMEKFTLQPEVLYSTQGAKISQSYVDGNDTKINLEYINIPVLVQYYVVEGFSISVGPQVGFLANAKYEIESLGWGGHRKHTVNAQKYYKNVDLGVAMGLSYRFPIGAFAQIRYVAGVSNMNEKDLGGELPFFNKNKNHNNVFQISLGYSF